MTLERILYVEDDPDIQVIAKLALIDLGGFSVTACASGTEAVAAFAEAKPQLVLLDVMMPGMDGPETMQELRKQPGGEHIPVVFMTAKVQAHEVSHYLDMGAAGVIRKPFDPMTLAEQIRALWKQAGAP